MDLGCAHLTAFPNTSLPAMDIAFTLERGSAQSAGLFIRCGSTASESTAARAAAAACTWCSQPCGSRDMLRRQQNAQETQRAMLFQACPAG